MESASKEDYLKAIYHLMEENHEARSVEVADYLDVKKPSVSEMLRTLGDDGFIQYRKYSKIKLTKKGIETFRLTEMLSKILGIKQKFIGFAGLKDKKAMTTQFISLYKVSKEKIESIKIKDVRIMPQLHKMAGIR